MKVLALAIALAIFCFTCSARPLGKRFTPISNLTLPAALYPGLNNSNVHNPLLYPTLTFENLTMWNYLLQNNATFSQLNEQLANLSDIVNILNTGRPVVFFAPTNNAFNQLQSLNSTGLWPNLNTTLFYHLFSVNVSNPEFRLIKKKTCKYFPCYRSFLF